MKKTFICLLLIFTCGFAKAEQFSGFKDYNVTAGFVYNLTQNIQLPHDKKGGTLCTISSNPADKVPSLLKKIYSAKRSLNIKVESYANISEITSINECDYFYVDASEKKSLPELVERTRGLPVVTIGNSRNFAKNGGTVGFIIEDGEDAAVEINVKDAKQRDVVINAQLLKIAQLYD